MEHKSHHHPKHTGPADAPQKEKHIHSHEEEFKGKEKSVLKEEAHGEHNGHMVEDFKKRFWISLIITVPIIIISPMIHHLLGIGDVLRFPGDTYVLFVLSSFVYFYGGYPFLKGFIDEIKILQPGMMTLIALAISVAYFYSSATVFGVKGEDFFWELATLIDIMLLGHWLEMKSVMGASRALEEMAKLMPDEAHKINESGEVVDVKITELKHKIYY